MSDSYQGGSGFAVVLVLFILLVIIGVAALKSYY
ncbi:YjcZ family sporulation protein [Bacillus sp. FJAT-47783]|nr:YjcZ family sporulation protein [Bacillus sp. FJAT-47783]